MYLMYKLHWLPAFEVALNFVRWEYLLIRVTKNASYHSLLHLKLGFAWLSTHPLVLHLNLWICMPISCKMFVVRRAKLGSSFKLWSATITSQYRLQGHHPKTGTIPHVQDICTGYKIHSECRALSALPHFSYIIQYIWLAALKLAAFISNSIYIMISCALSS